MRTQALPLPALLCVLAVWLIAHSTVLAQPRPVVEMFKETEAYVSARSKELAAAGKRMTAELRDDVNGERKALAAKYAAEASARPDLAKTDHYFIGRLYGTAGNDVKMAESMKRFLSEFPPDQKGDMIQSARSIIIAVSAKRKQMADAEAAFQAWRNGDPVITAHQPVLQDYLAVGYYKAGEYEPALRHAREAWAVLKGLKAKTLTDKRDREQIYMNLVEVLAMAHRKNKNTDEALNVLAEARAESFAIPSAELYRKVMTFVEGGGFSEKKLMQKVESYASADPAPEMNFTEWVGSDAMALENFRGKVVLLDFWATWCGPCIATFPRLRNWHKKYGSEDFVLLGVTQYYGEQDGKKMTPLQELDYLNSFKAKYKLPYPFAIANRGEDRMKYGINAYPTTVLLDRNGVVRYIGIGSGLEESQNLEEMIEKVLKEDTRLAAARK
jgi:thiol-disulfide isomerase/thioredoxin